MHIEISQRHEGISSRRVRGYPRNLWDINGFLWVPVGVKNPDPKGQALACYPQRGINRKPVKGILSILYSKMAKPTVSDLAQRIRFSKTE